MHEGITFFAAVWSVAFFAAAFRAARDGEPGGCARFVGLGGTAGFLAVGAVSAWLKFAAGGNGDLDYLSGLGIASLIGGLGKEQDAVRILAWNMFVKSLRAVADTAEKK